MENIEAKDAATSFGITAGITSIWLWSTDKMSPQIQTNTMPKAPPTPAAAVLGAKFNSLDYLRDTRFADKLYLWLRSSSRMTVSCIHRHPRTPARINPAKTAMATPMAIFLVVPFFKSLPFAAYLTFRVPVLRE